MAISRRQILSGAGAAGVGAAALTAPPAAAQSAAATAGNYGTPSIEQRVLSRALQSVFPMTFDGMRLGGPGWDLLERDSRASEFVLLGEEHGMVETPRLARQLFLALRSDGFDTLAIEISPPAAQDLDRAARGGLTGISAYIAAYPPGPPFYFWASEAEFIATVRAVVPGERDVLWGLDYEVTQYRRLIERLHIKAPHSAGVALARLNEASLTAAATWRESHNPGALFTFSGDPALVREVRAAWPRRDLDTDTILDTLEQTLEINALFATNGFESNLLRARFNRRNLVARLKRAAAEGRKPKLMFKMGESHLMRGVSWVGNFDVGSLAQEAAALRGGSAFSFLVGGGRNALHGVLNPTNMTVAPAPVDMLKGLGLGFLVDGVGADGPVVVDLRPLRPLLASGARQKAFNNPDAVRTIFSYDALVIWNGSTATHFLNT